MIGDDDEDNGRAGFDDFRVYLTAGALLQYGVAVVVPAAELRETVDLVSVLGVSLQLYVIADHVLWYLWAAIQSDSMDIRLAWVYGWRYFVQVEAIGRWQHMSPRKRRCSDTNAAVVQ